MKTLKAITLSIVLGVAAVAATGCTAAQKGAAGGGLIGGVAGSVVGNNWAVTSTGPATGAAVGGAGGAAVGGIAGDAYAKVTEADKARELENLRAELDVKEMELAALRESGLTVEALAELENTRKEVDRLRGELDDARQAALRASESQADALANLADERDRTRTLQERLADAEGEMKEQLAKLEQDRGALEEDIARLTEESERLRKQIAEREQELAEAQSEMNVLRTSLTGKETAMGELTRELDSLNVQLEQTSRGLTMTIVDSLLFAPGEADLTADGQQLLGDVAAILHDRFPNRELLIEGHTDNQPIVRSGWRSNWELGAARALNMLHELVGNHDISPDRVSATSYGEFRPTASNATAEGRRANRRAVIVILPEELTLEIKELAAANQ